MLKKCQQILMLNGGPHVMTEGSLIAPGAFWPVESVVVGTSMSVFREELVHRTVFCRRVEHLAHGPGKEAGREAARATQRRLCDRGARAHASNIIFLKCIDRRQTGRGHDVEWHRF